MRSIRKATVVAMLLILVLAQSALAAGPTVFREHLEFSDSQFCDDQGKLSYKIELSGQAVGQDFGDRLRIHILLRGKVWASNGTTLRVLHSWTEYYDFVAGTLTIAGLPFGTWVEGSSLRVHARGRLVVDLATFEPIFMAGQFPDGPPDPHAWTCELIAAAG
ncbi:MAG TPA: hypothetical protein VMP67_00970 [Candidatus Limnocylindria bacterium]|nr:hypothetical protein [Candidatus Limnocylindria bacterium]